ncbi:glycerol-3-phosphate dehydrogenase/oxidase [Echinicola vietnamensis]|uniref:Glycerol-3-phosphate dehydrogenase n=1 Tax=Echinicola vietnamensis (strain DSM 17526 / LMG 23754 / KMM 6221) TaxID=926556 RepID=L0FZ81_ECHVK|nr:glycerol-3-phosphate dehydrogenase/oxidase [Echinicola vietnamensis]AGA78036.1 glycerol-3-phosphate dehydrogenase [Echinicola vietnamensis DSM 17526]
MNRAHNLRPLAKNQLWDIVIIGGGASGLGVALDALSRGLSVALFERADFAKGTSSRSTKLVHGGVRYLAQGDILLVWEALRERGRILKNAPHLAHAQPFIIPIYSHATKYYYTVGLKFYDWMSGWLSLGDSSFISKKETIKRLPEIKTEGLLGGVVYHDGAFDDARLAIAVAQTCDDMGGCILNYMKVTSLTKDGAGIITGVKVRDAIHKKSYDVKAKMVVNATGVFADKILQMDQKGAPRMIQPSQGVHLVLPQHFLGGQDALMIPKTSDGRVLFAVPWQGKLVVGTTDTIRAKTKMEPEALSREINFILANAGQYLSKKPTRKDVLTVYAGLRPLAAPKGESVKTKEISRNHKVIISDSGLTTLTGGKWTTFRKMGEDTVDHFPRVTGEEIKESHSWEIKLHGHGDPTLDDKHWKIYGTDAVKILQLIKENPPYAKLLHPQYPYVAGEVIWAIREEMAMHIEDFLARRIRILLLDAAAAIAMAPLVASLMAAELKKDKNWIDNEVSAFTKIAEKYLIKP